jgi:hypothetical protein
MSGFHNLASRGAAVSLGTGAVVLEDPVKAVLDWKKSLSREPKPSDLPAWSEYAKRIGLGPREVEMGWAALVWVEQKLESTSWTGYWVANPMLVKMQTSAGPASFRVPEGPAWGPQGSFPFRTPAAEKVWELAKKSILKNKLWSAQEILRDAIADAKIPAQDLTPEDFRLLEMAIQWLQNGPVQTPNHLGGAPGGPANPSQRPRSRGIL